MFSPVCSSILRNKHRAAIMGSAATTNIVAHPRLVSVRINGLRAEALTVTGSNNSFIRESFAKQSKIKIWPHKGKVSTACVSLISEPEGSCNVKIHLKDRIYDNINCLVMKDLCIDVLWN